MGKAGDAMEGITVRAPSAAHAQRLVTALDGGFAATIDGGGSAPNEVQVRLDSETATQLVQLFDSLGRWLGDGEVETCQIAFGERTYTLLAAKKGEVNDPTQFLLERTIQLQTALDSRVVIEQAKGILAERHQISPDEAFERMRRDARSRQTRLHDVASEIIGGVTDAAK